MTDSCSCLPPRGALDACTTAYLAILSHTLFASKCCRGTNVIEFFFMSSAKSSLIAPHPLLSTSHVPFSSFQDGSPFRCLLFWHRRVLRYSHYGGQVTCCFDALLVLLTQTTKPFCRGFLVTHKIS